MPLQILGFRDPLAVIITRKLTAIPLTVGAALAGDRWLFVEALLADGAVTDPEVTHKMGPRSSWKPTGSIFPAFFDG